MRKEIEQEFLQAAQGLHAIGQTPVHGVQLALAWRQATGARRSPAFGDLHEIMQRLEKAGYFTSEVESAEVAATEDRVRRRLYTLTESGLRA